MKGEKKYLVILDVPSIKEYVFGTDRLVEIRGASALLDRLNREDTPNFLEEKLGKTNVECIFSNGGAGQFLLQAREDDLKKVLNDLKGHFFQQSRGGIRLVYGTAEVAGTNYTEALDLAFLSLKQEKEGRPILPSTMTHVGYIRECESCSGMATQLDHYGGEERILCAACAEKVSQGKKRGLWQEFGNFLIQKDKSAQVIDPARPKDFTEIGDCCQARRGHTALVYADGNAMGKLIKRLQTADQYRFFSTTVDQAIREACHEALLEHCPLTEKIPADILLLGGDDLLVYLSADIAFPFAIEVARRFAEKTQKRLADHPHFGKFLGGKGLTISLGISYGKSHTPFPIMLEQAEELLRSAKKAGSQDPRSGDYYYPTYIDYHMTSNFNQVQVENCRKTHLEIEGRERLFLYQKPYSLEDAQALLEQARFLVRSGFPSTRLKRLGFAPSLGKVNGTLECLKIYHRTRKGLPKEALRQALDQFECLGPLIPWKQRGTSFTTVLPDLIELTQFIPQTGEAKDA